MLVSLKTYQGEFSSCIMMVLYTRVVPSKGTNTGISPSTPKSSSYFARAALQISAAVTYLHEHSIICRDLKPKNIGFDVRGDGKEN